MKSYETAVVRPMQNRNIVYRILRELIDERIEKADSDEARERLIEQRNELDREFCGAIETRQG